jgi:hypothetical protein
MTLEEDWYLNPELGFATLHLDVPYDADVQVTHPYVAETAEGTEVRWHTSTVRSRGRYRHVVLTNMPIGKRERINVTATRWTTDPTCTTGRASVCRSAYAMAGDRRWVSIDETAFKTKHGEAKKSASSLFFVFASLPAPAEPPTEEPAEEEEARPDYAFVPLELQAFVNYSTDPTEGGIAKSFTFARHKAAPDSLRITHNFGDRPNEKHTGELQVTVVLDLKWKSPETEDAENAKQFSAKVKDIVMLEFKYDDKKKAGIAEISFKKDSALRLKIEESLPGALSVAHPITKIEMSGLIEFARQTHPIRGSIKINVNK